MYTIYEHISPSGKHYVGQTKQKVEKRWGKDGYNYLEKRKDGRYNQPLFANAILKYGWDSFEHNILFTGLTKEEANRVEKELVSK